MKMKRSISLFILYLHLYSPRRINQSIDSYLTANLLLGSNFKRSQEQKGPPKLSGSCSSAMMRGLSEGNLVIYGFEGMISNRDKENEENFYFQESSMNLNQNRESSGEETNNAIESAKKAYLGHLEELDIQGVGRGIIMIQQRSGMYSS